MNLTIDQLNLLISVIGERKKKDAVTQAMILRMAVVASLSEEGAKAFQRYVEETFSESRIIPVTSADLSQFGLGGKK